MVNEVVSYLEMCRREGASLQRGMNFSLSQGHSVILLSLRPNAPYDDRLEEDGSTLIYEGHDVPLTAATPNPKAVDQSEHTERGTPTQNGHFHRAAQGFKAGRRPAELVRAYEKLRQGIWSYNGLFRLVDSWREPSGPRRVFKFKLQALEEGAPFVVRDAPSVRRRVIPTHVKVEVWQRDGGKCVMCGASDELHFDHVVPYSKGGTSSTAANVQLLCARHNLEKRDRIE